MSDEAAPTPEEAVKLRGDPPRVMRLSRKAIGIASACGFALVGGALIYALQPASRAEREELLNTEGAARPDALADAPRDYGDVPKLGPPCPAILARRSWRHNSAAMLPSSHRSALRRPLALHQRPRKRQPRPNGSGLCRNAAPLAKAACSLVAVRGQLLSVTDRKLPMPAVGRRRRSLQQRLSVPPLPTAPPSAGRYQRAGSSHRRAPMSCRRAASFLLPSSPGFAPIFRVRSPRR